MYGRSGQGRTCFSLSHWPSIREGQSFSGLVVGHVSPDDVTRARLPPPSSFFVCRLPGRRVLCKLSSPRYQIRGSIVVSTSACHAEDPGSIPGRGVVSFKTSGMRASATSQHRSLCKNNQAFMEAQTSDSHFPPQVEQDLM